MTTKERITEEALTLFAEKGYKGTSVKNIADAVGIKAPSLYKHYKGKQDIFNAILEETARRYGSFTDGISVHLQGSDHDASVFEAFTADTLVEKVRALIDYSLHDEYVSRFGRMMTIEQVRSPEMSALYSQMYVDEIHHYHKELFAGMISAGVLEQTDPGTLAMMYDAPIFVWLGECDRHPEKEEECKLWPQVHASRGCPHNSQKEYGSQT